jgi:hypothetical protein
MEKPLKHKMKLHIISLSALLLVLPGCHSIKYGSVKITSFGQRTTINEAVVDPKTGVLKLKGYNNNQVDAIGAVAEGVARGLNPSPIK